MRILRIYASKRFMGEKRKMNCDKQKLKSLLITITIALAPFALALVNTSIVDSALPFAYAQSWAAPPTTWMNVTGGPSVPNWIFRVGYYPSPFTVNIEVSGVTDLFVWEFKLSWNASLLDVVSASEGSFLNGEVPGTTAFYSETFQDQIGLDYMFVNCTLLDGAGKSGSGVIATVDLDLDASAMAGSAPLNLYETKLRDSSMEINHGVTDGFVLMGDHNTYPLIYILPQTCVADPGQMFNVTVWIDNVESLQAWGFNLYWTNSLLEATNIVNHVFLEGTSFGVEGFDNGAPSRAYASQVLSGAQEGTYGGGPLATITFMVEAAGKSALNLVVTDNDLWGIYYNPPEKPFTYQIPHATFEGRFQSTSALAQPHAYFTYSPLLHRVNDTITFDASSSSDPDGSIVSYAWDFGDGAVKTLADPIATHVYVVAGTYTVSLTVTDNDGLEDAVMDLLYVESGQPKPSPPIAIFHYSPPWPLANQTVVFDASYSYDPDGFITVYLWDFGDGTVDNGTTPVTTHVYAELGTYLIRLTIVDNDGLIGSMLKYLTTVPPEPEVYVYPSTVETSPSDAFRVDIRIQDVENLYGWQVSLS